MDYTRKTVSFRGEVTSITQLKDWNIKDIFYQLTIATKESSLGVVKVYRRKVAEAVWKDIEEHSCLNQSYLFITEKLLNSYHLKEWKLI